MRNIYNVIQCDTLFQIFCAGFQLNLNGSRAFKLSRSILFTKVKQSNVQKINFIHHLFLQLLELQESGNLIG